MRWPGDRPGVSGRRAVIQGQGQGQEGSNRRSAITLSAGMSSPSITSGRDRTTPTDNLDLASAEALQQGLAVFSSTVVAVTHDRWFATDFDRFPIFGSDGLVYESAEPIWHEGRVERTH